MKTIYENVDLNFNECKLVIDRGNYLVVINDVIQFEMDELIINDLNKLYGDSRFDLEDEDRAIRAFNKFCEINIGM